MPRGVPKSGKRAERPDDKKGGRPKTLPPDTFTKSYRATAAEHAALKALLERLRAERVEKPASG